MIPSVQTICDALRGYEVDRQKDEIQLRNEAKVFTAAQPANLKPTLEASIRAAAGWKGEE